MEVKPVKQAEKPGYPLKAELREEELKKLIPKRWMQSPAVKIALGTLAVVTLAGCAPEVLAGVAEAVTPPAEASVSSTPTNYVPEDTYAPEGTPTPAMINVAPLFEHGEGRGTYGGPPQITALLSEDEALGIINAAAKEYGLEFSSNNGAQFLNVLQPVTELDPSGMEGESNPAPPDTFINFEPDFFDSKHGIVIEFVSTDDVEKWSRDSSRATAVLYDAKDAAAQLSEALERAEPRDYGSYSAGVLYEPCLNAKEGLGEYEEIKAKLRHMTEEQLAAQAKDFFEWLKQRGVI